MRRLCLLVALVAVIMAGCEDDDKPTAPAPTGSCCAVNGACTVTTQASCTSTWTANAVCTPNPCPQPAPTGACCLEGTGRCSVTTRAACPGGWTEAGVCEPNPCPQPAPTGSCCGANRTCTITTLAACSGNWTEGGVCEPNPCPQLPQMILIPAGPVRLGQAGIAEPVHNVVLDAFWIDRNEVTNAAFKAFIDAGGYQTEAYWNPVGWAWRVAQDITLPGSWSDPAVHGGGTPGNELFPVSSVSWWEADAYCRWAGGRLPSEAEWEKAAKGGCETHGEAGACETSDSPSYPWGEVLSGNRANFWGSLDPYELGSTPAGFYDGSSHGGYQTVDSPSPYGLYDVVGNVWEWCSSTSLYPYPYNAKDGREAPPASYDEPGRVLRGGSWESGGYSYLRCAVRYDGYAADSRTPFVGFRCARDE